MSLPIFSARLLDLMQFNNLSIHKLAADIAVQRKSIINWVEGRNYPRYDALIKLANYFKVSTDYLVGLADNNTQYNHVNSYTKVQIHARLVEILNEFLNKNHLTKYAFSRMLNMEQSTVERWFKKGAMPEVSVLIRISEKTNKSLDYLLGWE